MGVHHQHRPAVRLDVAKLAHALIAERRRWNVFQVDVARDCGILGCTVSRLERNHLMPSAEALLSLCDWLGRNPFEFVRRNGK